MTNGTNSWDVSYSQITWLERALNQHANVISVQRRLDLVFDIERKKTRDQISIFCCNEYTMGITLVHKALHEFGRLNLIYIGGGWCSYTKQAKDYCLQSKIGLFTTEELTGALWKKDHWNYHKRD